MTKIILTAILATYILGKLIALKDKKKVKHIKRFNSNKNTRLSEQYNSRLAGF